MLFARSPSVIGMNRIVAPSLVACGSSHSFCKKRPDAWSNLAVQEESRPHRRKRQNGWPGRPESRGCSGVLLPGRDSP